MSSSEEQAPSWMPFVDEYIGTLRKESTRKKYRHALKRSLTVLDENGYQTDPRQIGEEDVYFLLDEYIEADLEVTTYSWYISILCQLLTFYYNQTITRMKIDYEQDFRVNTDWLTKEQAAELLLSLHTPLERLGIHLELCLGLRRIEVLRLRLQDLHEDHIDVLGKGRGKGRWRSVSIDEETKEIIRDYIDSERTPLIREALDVNPDLPVPDTLIIWKKYKYKPQLGSYAVDRGSGYDNAVIHKVRDRVSFHFSNHTLRRTFARMAYEAGASIEEIAEVLGHKDLWTTRRYIGLTIEHQAKGLKKLSGMISEEKEKMKAAEAAKQGE